MMQVRITCPVRAGGRPIRARIGASTRQLCAFGKFGPVNVRFMRYW